MYISVVVLGEIKEPYRPGELGASSYIQIWYYRPRHWMPFGLLMPKDSCNVTFIEDEQVPWLWNSNVSKVVGF